MSEVIIRKFKESYCKLYKEVENVPNGLFVGEVTSIFQVNDIQIQCKKLKSNNYFFLWENPEGIFWRIQINENGYLSNYPVGFFDLFDDQLNELLNVRIINEQ